MCCQSLREWAHTMVLTSHHSKVLEFCRIFEEFIGYVLQHAFILIAGEEKWTYG